MDTVTLVEPLISDGHQLIEHLIKDGVGVSAAFWVKPRESDRWKLTIATDLLDSGIKSAYLRVLGVLRRFGDGFVMSSDISLIHPTDPAAVQVLEILKKTRGRFPNSPPIATSLGGISIESLFIYNIGIGYTDLTEEEKQTLIRCYSATNMSVDDLPYSDEMDQIREEFNKQTGLSLSVRELFKALLNLRKQRKLVRKLEQEPVTSGA